MEIEILGFQANSISLRIIVDVRVCRLLLFTTDHLVYPTMEADWWHIWSISDFIMYLFCGLTLRDFVSSFRCFDRRTNSTYKYQYLKIVSRTSFYEKII